MKSLLWFSAAALLDGLTWWAFMFVADDPHNAGLLELIQLGGTGGLVLALLAAVVAMWRERRELRDEIASTHSRYADELGTVRAEYANQLELMSQRHRTELQDMTDRYTEELKSQIQALRDETQGKLDAERERANHRYEKRGE